MHSIIKWAEPLSVKHTVTQPTLLEAATTRTNALPLALLRSATDLTFSP